MLIVTEEDIDENVNEKSFGTFPTSCDTYTEKMHFQLAERLCSNHPDSYPMGG